jgi:CheY-like chemotaxis protein
MGGDPGEPVHVIRTKRSRSARIPPSRRPPRVPPAQTRYRRHEPGRPEHAAPGPAGSSGKTGARHVLIVDDEFSIRLICSINFAASGWRCTEAVDGVDALEQVKRERPDVILLDVMMPRADGWTVAEHLADDEATGDIPIVFLTARAERRDRERAHKLGAVGYLTKPLDPVDLPGTVEDVLRRLERGEREQLRGEVLTGG